MMSFSRCFAAIIFPTALLVLPAAAAPAQGGLAGEYVCKSMGSGACDTQTTISLREDGTWSWRYFSGQYQVSGGSATFKGTGLGSWGPAAIGPGTLTFTSGGQKVVFQKPSAAPSSLAGTYVCATARGGCQTGNPIRIQADGTWSWGAQHSTYSIVGGQIRFSGLSSGPAGWGLADIGSRSITFRSSYGPSEWKKQ